MSRLGKGRRRRNRKKKRKVRNPKDRLEGDLPREEYQWLNRTNRTLGPTDSGIPPGLQGVSEMPELTVAWVVSQCRFSCARDREEHEHKGIVSGTVVREDGSEVRQTASV